MQEIIDILHNQDCSCVIKNNGEIRSFTQKGIADLYNLLKNDPDFLKGALVADKVVGKAAAALMKLGEVKEVYTDLISLPALMLYGDTHIKVEYGASVPVILNRDQTDWCPMEKLCYNEKSSETILPLIEEFIKRMRMNNNPQSVAV